MARGTPSGPQAARAACAGAAWRAGSSRCVVWRGQAAALLRLGAFLPLGDFVMENIRPTLIKLRVLPGEQ